MLKKIIIFFGSLSASLFAQSYALVIGINNGNLIGAQNDAYAMSQLLRDKHIQHIKPLYGNSATKHTIVNEFKKIVEATKPKDWVYLFFSGHGTSPFDPYNKNRPKLRQRLKNTGALLASDNQWVVIKESLSPLFKILDKREVHTVVIFDACFSGMAYKDVFNQGSNLPFYTPKPTRKSAYPYKHLIYLSSSTYTDYSSESAQYKRGYFSMAITHCLAKNSDRYHISSCLNHIKYDLNQLPQTPVVLPKSNFVVFPSYTKDINITPTYFSLKEKLFNLAPFTQDFQLYSENSQGIPSKNYAVGEKVTIRLESKERGYFVLFQMGESNKIKLSYPNANKMPYIKANTNKKILELKATTPVGEELMGAYLVDKTTALELQKLYQKSNGELLDVADIKRAISLIKKGQIVGSKLLWISHEK